MAAELEIRPSDLLDKIILEEWERYSQKKTP
jgi:hypothetical protein